MDGKAALYPLHQGEANPVLCNLNLMLLGPGKNSKDETHAGVPSTGVLAGGGAVEAGVVAAGAGVLAAGLALAAAADGAVVGGVAVACIAHNLKFVRCLANANSASMHMPNSKICIQICSGRLA